MAGPTLERAADAAILATLTWPAWASCTSVSFWRAFPGLAWRLLAVLTLYLIAAGGVSKNDRGISLVKDPSAGSRPFCPFPDRPNHVMAYWEVPAEVLEDAEQLRLWTREALAAALAARSKRSARRRRPAGHR